MAKENNNTGAAPYQVNVNFKYNQIGKVDMHNAAPNNGGDDVQVNTAEVDQDINQKNKQKARIVQETGDTFSIAVDRGPGSAVSIARSEHNLDADVEQDAKNNAKQKSDVDQEND